MRRVLFSATVIFLAGTAQVLAQTPQSLKPAPDAEVGKQAYMDNCARCHGPDGAGDGRDAKRMHPRPRKLSEGVFKFRTTASGTPPTDEDLFETVSNGLPGSRMPDFQRLPEDVRWQMVYHVKSLSPVFQEQKPEPLAFGKDPGPKGANLVKGAELYTQLGCNACHGPVGRGNGPSAATLVDQWGDSIDPADLTQGWSYRSGSSPRDVLVRLMTGLDGTPMPSYAEAVKPEEVWDLAYYVHSIQTEPQWKRKVNAVKETLGWEKAPRTDLRLSSTFYRGGEIVPSSVQAVSVQALYNEKELLLRLSWHDRTESRETPPDAAAVALLEDPNLGWRSGSLRGWTGEQEPADLVSYQDGEWTALLKRPLPQEKKSGFGIMVWDGGNSEQGRHRSNSNWVDLVLKD